jgi:hypothetical protein
MASSVLLFLRQGALQVLQCVCVCVCVCMCVYICVCVRASEGPNNV